MLMLPKEAKMIKDRSALLTFFMHIGVDVLCYTKKYAVPEVLSFCHREDFSHYPSPVLFTTISIYF